MKPGRIVVLALLALALVALALDLHAFLDRGELGLAPLGQRWADLHRNSLLLLQPAIERHVTPLLWEWLVFPLLEQPAVPVFLALALLVQCARWWLARRRARREGRFMLRPKAPR